MDGWMNGWMDVYTMVEYIYIHACMEYIDIYIYI